MNKCSKCGRELPDKLLFCYVDGNNEAITKHSKDYCWRCYNEKYPNDKISISTILTQYGHKTEIDSDESHIYLYVDDKRYVCTPTLVEELIKEYNL